MAYSFETLSYEEYKKRYGTVGLAQAQGKIKDASVWDRMKQTAGQEVKNTFQGGVERMKEGVRKIDPAQGNNPFRGARDLVGGALQSAFSPIAPAFKSVSDGLGYAADKISNNPSVQKFANTKVGQQTAEVAQDVSDLTNVAGTLGGSRLAMQGLNKLTTRTPRPIVPPGGGGGGSFSPSNIETQARNIFQGVKDTATMAYDEAKRIPDRIQTNVAEKQAFNQKIKDLPTPASQRAAQDGVDIGDIETINNLPKEQRGAFKGLADTVRDFASGKSKTNPIEVVGRPITQRLKDLEKVRGKVGKKLGEVADTLGSVTKAETFDAVFSKLKAVPGLEGLSINNKGILNFSNTVLTTLATKADRRVIQATLNDALKRGTGKGKHLLRQELYETLKGKKRSLVNLTDTQERALQAVRSGLGDLLDKKNTQYKKLNQSYSKIKQPLDQMRKMMRLSGVSDDILDMKAGLLARRLTSMAASNPEIRGILNALDNATQSIGKTKLSVEALQDFYNILEKYYDVAPKTGFQAQITRGIESASSIKDFAAGKLREFAGETSAVRQKALERLLDEIFGENVGGKGSFLDNPLIQEARKYKSVDEFVKSRGEPLYHGTNATFEVFDPKKMGSATDYGLYGNGFYFGNTESFARIAPSGRLAKNVMEVYPKSRNFFEISNIKSINEMAEFLDMSPDSFVKETNGIIRPLQQAVPSFSYKVKDMGYDGVVVKRGGDAIETVVFDPKNIQTKSQLTDIWNKANGL